MLDSDQKITYLDKLKLYKKSKVTKTKSKSINSDLDWIGKNFQSINKSSKCNNTFFVDLDKTQNFSSCYHKNKFSLNFTSARSLSKKSNNDQSFSGYKSTNRKSIDETQELLSEKAQFSAYKKVSNGKLSKLSKLDMIMRYGRQEISDNGSKVALR